MRPIKSQTIFQNAPESPLGRVPVVGYIRNSSGVPCDNMRILGSYALVLMLEGSGFYRDKNGFSMEVLPGDLLLIFPDLAHCYGPYEYSHWTEIYFIFEGAAFDLWRQSGVISDARPHFRLGAPEYWLRRLEEIAGENRAVGSPAPLNSLRQVCALQNVLAEAIAATESSQREHQWLQRAYALLEKTDDFYEKDESPLHAVARSLNMSYSSFRKKFAQLTGTSPGQYRLSRLMDKACEMVYEGKLSNKEVAAKLGFCDEFHFSRQFKRVTGFSPSELRRKLPRSGS